MCSYGRKCCQRLKNRFIFSRFATAIVTELKDKKLHHICAMWNNTDGMASLFVDGSMRVRSQGHRLGWMNTWDGRFVLGDTGQVSSDVTCILTCVRLWTKTMSEEEVKMAHEDKKCEKNDGVTVAWPWFKMADLYGKAAWTNSSSMWKEDLGMLDRFDGSCS